MIIIILVFWTIILIKDKDIEFFLMGSLIAITAFLLTWIISIIVIILYNKYNINRNRKIKNNGKLCKGIIKNIEIRDQHYKYYKNFKYVCGNTYMLQEVAEICIEHENKEYIVTDIYCNNKLNELKKQVQIYNDENSSIYNLGEKKKYFYIDFYLLDGKAIANLESIKLNI